MPLLDPRSDDEAIVANANRLLKSGVRLPPAGSPDRLRIDNAFDRQNVRERSVGAFSTAINADNVLKAQLARGATGSSSTLHEETALAARERGDRGWTAVDRLLATPGLMGGPGVDMGGRRAEFDPRNPGDPAYYDAEARSQIERADTARAMAKAGQDKLLGTLKVMEATRRNPLVGEAMEIARAKARRKGRPVKAKDFKKAFAKLSAAHGEVQKSTLGGLLGNVVDLRTPGIGR